MISWRQRGSIWQLCPTQPVGLVEFIGGSYLAATPHVSYRRLLEQLGARNLAVHAWGYVPGFDHQSQARQVRWPNGVTMAQGQQQGLRKGGLPAPIQAATAGALKFR